MSPDQIIDAAAQHIQHKFANEGSGHDWWHIFRVWQTARTIAIAEQADLYTVQLAALLHDIGIGNFMVGI